jgi:hypothetical protein
MKDYFPILILIISVVWHEWGHVFIMKELGIFKELKFHWTGSVECEVDKDADVDIGFFDGIMIYLIGFIFSFIPYPIWFFLGLPFHVFLLFQIGISVVDFFYCGKLIFLVKNFNKNEGMKRQIIDT